MSELQIIVASGVIGFVTGIVFVFLMTLKWGKDKVDDLVDDISDIRETIQERNIRNIFARLDEVEITNNLILEEMGKTYIPESEEITEAHLVDKKNNKK